MVNEAPTVFQPEASPKKCDRRCSGITMPPVNCQNLPNGSTTPMADVSFIAAAAKRMASCLKEGCACTSCPLGNI